MPDSFAPSPWDSAQFDERDLDALLAAGTALTGSTGSSGDTGPSVHDVTVPSALRQVADTLAALCAAPSPAELRGEAAIRAEFRAALASAASDAGRGPATTVVLPATATRRRRHGLPKHARPGTRPRRSRLAAGAFAAAAVVIAVAAAYSGQLPGPAQRLAHDALAAPSARQSGATKGGSPRVDATSAQPVRSPSDPAAANSAPPVPAVSSSAGQHPANAAALCAAFYQSLEHRSFRQPWWNTSAYKNVSAAAGGTQHVPGYCAAEWAKLRPHDYPQVPVFPGLGNHDTGNAGSGNAGANQGPENSSGNGAGNGLGNSSNGNSSGSNSSGSQDSGNQDSTERAPADLAPAARPTATQAPATPAPGKAADTAPAAGTSQDTGNGNR
jgi:hypothetical protein